MVGNKMLVKIDTFMLETYFFRIFAVVNIINKRPKRAKWLPF